MSTATLPPKPTQRILVQPMLNEAQDRYVERADRALQKRIVDRNSRMSQIFADWSASGAESELQSRAAHSLASVAECDPSQLDQHFVIRRNRPVFPEHDVKDPQGRVIHRYDRAALAKIVACCNKRIMDTGDLAAMSAGHTPDPDQQASGMPMPPMVGLMGPFRMGMVGEQAPKWCIFADEAIFKDDWPAVKKMPRRSAEIWMEPRMEDRAMDPVAVLGSETPRLDTGVGRFSRRLDAARYRNVARYSMGAASFPSGSNTFIEKYSDQAAESAKSVGGNMDQEAIQAIVDAVMQGIAATPQWQFLTDAMQTSQNPTPEAADQGPTPSPTASEGVTDPSNPTGVPADPTAIPAASTGGDATPAPAAPTEAKAAEPTAEPTHAESKPDPTADANTPADPKAAEPPKQAPPMADSHGGSGATPEELAAMGNEERDEYSRLSPTHQYGYMMARRRHCKAQPGSMQYSSPVERERYSRVESENQQLRGEVNALRADRTYRERYSKLSELNQIHEFDVNEESDECKAMTDEQFEKHCSRIVTKYSRRDPNGGMPTLALPPLERDSSDGDKKVERHSRRAVEIATKSGGTMSWSDAMAKAKSEIDG